MERSRRGSPPGRWTRSASTPLAMLEAMRDHLALRERAHAGALPFRAHHLLGRPPPGTATTLGRKGSPSTTPQWRDVLDELRLDPRTLRTGAGRALNHVPSAPCATEKGRKIDSERLSRGLADFRASRSLRDRASLAAWLSAHDLDEASLSLPRRGCGRPVGVEPLRTSIGASRTELRFDDSYVRLRDRA